MSKRKMNTGRAQLAAVIAMMAVPMIAHAAPVTWDGSTANWVSSPSHWSNSGTPNLSGGTDTATIGSGSVTYNGTGGDLAINSSLTINGTGSLTQTSNNWIKVGSGSGNTGTLNLSGTSSYNTGTAVDHFWVGYSNSTGYVNVSGGTLTTTSTYLEAGTISVTGGTYSTNTTAFDGGTVSVNGGTYTNLSTGGTSVGKGLFSMASGTANFSGEFKPTGSGTTVSITGGTLNTTLISFDGSTSAVLGLGGGLINIAQGTNYNGIFAAGAGTNTGYVNFLSGSTGKLFLNGDTTGSNANALLSGRVRSNGVISSSAFKVTLGGGGSTIQLASVPEPASLALLAMTSLFGLRRRRCR